MGPKPKSNVCTQVTTSVTALVAHVPSGASFRSIAPLLARSRLQEPLYLPLCISSEQPTRRGGQRPTMGSLVCVNVRLSRVHLDDADHPIGFYACALDLGEVVDPVLAQLRH